MTRPVIRPGPLAALLLLLLLPAAGEAQRRGRNRQPQPSGPWPPVTVGVHVGYDDNSNGTVLGAQIRAPILRDGKVELMPAGAVTFLTGLKEYQLNVDAVFMPGGSRGGIYVAGGLALRNTVFTGGEGRRTKTGAGVAVGIRTGSRSRVGTQLEFRQIFVDSDLRPRMLTFGVNVALWGGGASARER